MRYSYQPKTIQRAVDAIAHRIPTTTEGIVETVLDALVVDAPLVRQQHPGPVVLEWPPGFDPDADPTDGAQFLLVDVRLFARLVQRLNDAEESLHGVSAFIPSALTDDETQT